MGYFSRKEKSVNTGETVKERERERKSERDRRQVNVGLMSFNS